MYVHKRMSKVITQAPVDEQQRQIIRLWSPQRGGYGAKVSAAVCCVSCTARSLRPWYMLLSASVQQPLRIRSLTVVFVP